jgi:hypothetical protein
VLESDFIAESGAPLPVPVLIRHYGPVQKSNSSISWNSCFTVECRPLFTSGDENCHWMDVSSAFTFFGPGDSGWPFPNMVGMAHASGMYPTAGVYRVKLRVSSSTGLPFVRCAGVTGNPPVAWPVTCADNATYPNAEAQAYIFRVAPDCDFDRQNDEVVSPNQSMCPTTCRVDVNHSGTISVQDIFDFLTAWFAGCYIPSNSTVLPTGCTINSDWNDNHTLEVADIFAYLGSWFSSGHLNCQ